jgi:Flp pilus assembly protein TadD
MTARALLTSAAALLLASCVKTVEDPSLRTPAAPRRPVAPPTPINRPTAVAEAISRQVRNAIDAGEGDVRLMAMRRKVALNPDDLPARIELAKGYIASGFPDVALEHYRVAAMRFPDSAEVAVELARTLRAMKLPGEARVALEQFVSGHAQAPADVLSWLAILHDEANEYATAEQYHRSAVEKRPTSDSLRNNLGYNLLLQGRNAEAAAEFRAALDIAPQSVVARNNLGIATVSDPADAVMQWQRVSDPATAHNNMAALLIEKGNYAEARKELDTALRYRADHQAALNNLQLVSELDGAAAQLRRAEAVNSIWRRFLYLLVGEGAVKPDTELNGSGGQSAASR